MNISPKALLTQLDSISERKLLWVNIALACFVALSHGGALAVSSSAPTEQTNEIRRLAMVSLPMAAFMILAGAIAIRRPHLTRAVLGMHGAVLCVSAAALLLWALSILVGGLPSGKFVWTTGLLTAWVGYAVFVMSRYTISILVGGLPSGKFVWTTGLLTAWVGYAVFVMSRYTILARIRNFPIVFFLPVIAVALALPIDIGVAIKLLSSNG